MREREKLRKEQTRNKVKKEERKLTSNLNIEMTKETDDKQEKKKKLFLWNYFVIENVSTNGETEREFNLTIT